MARHRRTEPGRGWLFALVLGLALAGGGSGGCASHPGVEVPFVPTPHAVVAEMLRLAAVGKDDVVYDLGSGDGRLVIAAARDFGARGVGIEIDPRLVAASIGHARRAGVADRVSFVEQDLFQADLGSATVVTLYLTRDLNLRLRPKLLGELRPGARIVSHNYDMGDWQPARTTRVEADGQSRPVFLWVVPGRPRGDGGRDRAIGEKPVGVNAPWPRAIPRPVDVQLRAPALPAQPVFGGRFGRGAGAPLRVS